jgi:hypothetical protein
MVGPTRSLHTTMGEDHVNMALCLENNETPPPARNQEHHIPRDALEED